jgi:hypothetical protein
MNKSHWSPAKVHNEFTIKNNINHK